MALPTDIILPNGEKATPAPLTTERQLERAQEDSEYVSVIVKRSDEAKRHPDDILKHAIADGLTQLNRPGLSLGLSSVAAGLILGLSIAAVAVATGALSPMFSPLLTRILAGLLYPLGFIVCVMSGTQLFTEHTATALYPVLDRQVPIGRLLRLWAIVIFGNLIGVFISAVLVSSANDVIHANAGYQVIAEHLFEFKPSSLILSAVLAGWLMAQGAWLVLSSSEAIAQMASIYIVTFLIAVAGLHHSIAGSAEAFTAYLLDPALGVTKVAHFIGLALIGNLIGGSLFVGALNYTHIRRTQVKPQPVLP